MAYWSRDVERSQLSWERQNGTDSPTQEARIQRKKSVAVTIVVEFNITAYVAALPRVDSYD